MNLKRVLTVIALSALFLTGFAQERKAGNISGTIKDARSKTPLIEAVITVSSTAFKGQKFAVTDSLGTYHVNNLPAGNYTISFEMEGYEKYVQENIALQDGMAVAINYEMVKEGRTRKIDK